MGKKIDLTGQRFGRLVVVREVQRQPWETHTKAMWECRCDCGQVVTVQSSNLRAGITRSCGCIVREHAIRLAQQKAADIAGKRYGELAVIERAEKPNDGAGKKYPNSSWWRCRCSCGREVVLAGQYIKQAPRPHCGCKRDEIREAQKKIGHDGSYVRVQNTTGRVELRGKDGSLRGVIRNDRKCSQCGRTFDMYAGADWAWKTQRHGKQQVFCSYGCMRKYDYARPRRYMRAYE